MSVHCSYSNSCAQEATKQKPFLFVQNIDSSTSLLDESVPTDRDGPYPRFVNIVEKEDPYKNMVF